MKRIPLALVFAALVACGRLDAQSDASSGVVPGADVAPSGGEVQPTPSFASAPELLPFLGAPPLWNLDRAQTIDVMREFFNGDPVSRFGLPESCSGESSSWVKCEGAVWEKFGVDSAATALKREFHLSVFAVEGSGPVWVAWLYDWSYYESNGYNEDHIFTPAGILTHRGLWSWQAYHDAIEEAETSDMYGRINDAIEGASEGYWTPYAYGQFGGEDIFMGAPVATADGWAVPLTMGLTGCHACQSEFAGRFAIDFAADGTPTGVRFLDHCYYPDDVARPWAADPAVLEIKAEIPACEPHTAYDGSVSPFQRFTMDPTS